MRDLQDVLAKVKLLSGLLPICAACKKIRDDEGTWSQLEIYVHRRSEATFSRGQCLDCTQKLYPDLFAEVGCDPAGTIFALSIQWPGWGGRAGACGPCSTSPQPQLQKCKEVVKTP